MCVRTQQHIYGSLRTMPCCIAFENLSYIIKFTKSEQKTTKKYEFPWKTSYRRSACYCFDWRTMVWRHFSAHSDCLYSTSTHTTSKQNIRKMGFSFIQRFFLFNALNKIIDFVLAFKTKQSQRPARHKPQRKQQKTILFVLLFCVLLKMSFSSLQCPMLVALFVHLFSNEWRMRFCLCVFALINGKDDTDTQNAAVDNEF